MTPAKKLLSAILAVGLGLGLTACDPPMPDDIRVAESEKIILCEPGVAELQLPEAITDLGFTWADAMAVGCSDMQLSVVGQLSEPTGLIISPAGVDLGQPSFLKIPFALDAAVLVVNIPDVFEIFLSAPVIQGIFSGEITNWSDPLILADNEGYELPDLKIVLPKQALPAAKTSLSTWIENITGSPLNLSKIADTTVSEGEKAAPGEPGAIAIASYSAALFNGSVFASVLTEPANFETAVLPSIETIYAASTQLVYSVEGDVISVTLDPSLTPTPPEGSDAADLPYQGVFVVELSFMGEESKLIRTAGRYLMRQESKGVIASSTMLPIPESLRILAVKIIESKLDVPPVE
jgi:phosphate transport system substrate-binding protein